MALGDTDNALAVPHGNDDNGSSFTPAGGTLLPHDMVMAAVNGQSVGLPTPENLNHRLESTPTSTSDVQGGATQNQAPSIQPSPHDIWMNDKMVEIEGANGVLPIWASVSPEGDSTPESKGPPNQESSYQPSYKVPSHAHNLVLNPRDHHV